MQHDVDVAVIGLGTAGSMALWHLSREPGVRVLGIEQFGIGHTYGSFSGESRLFRTAVHEGAQYVPLLQQARPLWRELEQEVGRTLYHEVGTLNVGEPDEEAMDIVRGTIAQYDLEHRVLDATELRAEYPQHAVSDSTIAVLDPHAGILRPEPTVVGGVDVAVRNGATILENTPVEAIEPDADGVTIRTADRTIRAGKVIVSTGSWATRLLPELTDLLHIVQLSLTWFAPRDISAFTPERFPAFLRDQDGVHLFGGPTLDGASVKVSAGPLWPSLYNVDDVPRTISREDIRTIGAQAAKFFPDLHPEPVRVDVYHDAETPDRVPVLNLDESERVVTVAGLSGHGFKFAPIFGRIARDLALDGGSPLYDPSFALSDHLRKLSAK